MLHRFSLHPALPYVSRLSSCICQAFLELYCTSIHRSLRWFSYDLQLCRCIRIRLMLSGRLSTSPFSVLLCFVFLVFMHLSRSIWEMFCMYKQTSASNIESYVYFEAEIKGLKDRISECLHFLVKAVIWPCLPQHVFVFFLDALSGQNLLLLAICLFDFLHCMYTTIPVCFG